MLDSITKKRIDDLRDILVGKIPSPQSQVEQITTGLIYKFMYDMDQEAIEMGGVPSFFVNDYEKYSWEKLFDPKLGGADKVQLYSDAIEHMYTNPTAPQLFREIFKNSFLPFKDPATLNMFLKEINEFHYSHSEKLGDAFEYLLSFMGSQGDAGQFRTPRHIIDFVVEIINPKKGESVLDPACGTAGFLISSYKHILKQNTEKKLGDKLTASDRKNIGDNLVGYDISPDMTRISMVNMYLHQFASPQIHEYDTLSSEDRWNEYYDVILANPPFFSPTGGIQPHSRFGVQSTRAEVLFVDYIMEHLKPTGRAGIVVPEGILFQTGNAYKTLRKKLIDDSLIAVISLPSGIFQPYSGVKTSILILDKNLNKNLDEILFAKIENDGFSLGTQRTPIEKNDLPNVLKEFNNIHSKEFSLFKSISKSRILESNVYLLSFDRYSEKKLLTSYEQVTLKDIANISSGNSAPQDSEMFVNGIFPFVRTADVGNIKFGTISETKDYLNSLGIKNLTLFSKGSILFPKSGASTLLNHRVMLDIDAYVASHLAVIKGDPEKVLDAYLLYILKKIDAINLVNDPSYPSLNLSIIKELKIPLPPIEIQQIIVNELDSYQKIINGCFDVINNFKPTIKIDPNWDKILMRDLGETKSGGTPLRSSQEYWNGDIPWYSSGELNALYTENCLEFISQNGLNNSNCRIFPTGSLLIGMYDTAAFKMSILDRDATFNQAIYGIKTNAKVNPIYLYLYLMTEKEKYLNDRVGVRQRNLSKNYIDEIVISLPDLSTQQSIVKHFEDEISLVNGCKQLIKINSKKIIEKIDDIWGKTTS
jgi:type I restriction enzyme M protein